MMKKSKPTPLYAALGNLELGIAVRHIENKKLLANLNKLEKSAVPNTPELRVLQESQGRLLKQISNADAVFPKIRYEKRRIRARVGQISAEIQRLQRTGHDAGQIAKLRNELVMLTGAADPLTAVQRVRVVQVIKPELQGITRA